MKNIFLIQAFSLMCLNLFAQQENSKIIEGSVTGSANQPLHMATVYIIGSRVGVQTDEKGNYKFFVPDSVIQKKDLLICCHYPGYFTDTFQIKPEQLPLKLNITLLERHALGLVDFPGRYPIFGYVINSTTHQPMADVKVKVFHFGNMATSNREGIFQINFPRSTKQKEVTVCFSRKGFERKILKLDISTWTEERVIRMVKKGKH